MLTTRRNEPINGLIFLDILLINAAFYLSYIIRYRVGIPNPVDPLYDAPFLPAYGTYAILLTVLCILAYAIDGLYELRRGRPWTDSAYRLVNGTMTSILIVMAVTFFVQPPVYSRGMLILAAILIVVFLSAARIGAKAMERALLRRGIGVARVLIVGAGETGRAVMRSILADPLIGYQLVGYVDDDPSKGESELGRIQGLGGLDQINELIRTENIAEVIVYAAVDVSSEDYANRQRVRK